MKFSKVIWELLRTQSAGFLRTTSVFAEGCVQEQRQRTATQRGTVGSFLMVTIEQIKNAKNITELDELVEQAAEERSCALDSWTSYADQAEWLETEARRRGRGYESMLELAEILKVADERWFELERIKADRRTENKD
ncbi:MAG: hypothetical protein KIS79_01340 [Burkholderiales bacterium]|nr:hypothetical protein [Burkholderiales bacterium]